LKSSGGCAGAGRITLGSGAGLGCLAGCLARGEAGGLLGGLARGMVVSIVVAGTGIGIRFNRLELDEVVVVR
jgi:hypothetical protein